MRNIVRGNVVVDCESLSYAIFFLDKGEGDAVTCACTEKRAPARYGFRWAQ
jgi:hypothetical protein